jgi:hypothetical protein
MRGMYIILLGLLGCLLLGCITPVEPEAGEDVIITTDQECIGCADEEEETPPAEEEEPEEVEEEAPVEEAPEEIETLTFEEARAIALNSSCMDEGNLTGNYIYNNYTRTWWFDMDIEMPGCMPACVVDEETRTAEINWRCTGLITPENETEEYENVTGCIGPNETEYDIYVRNETWYHGELYQDECALATVVKDYYCKNDELQSINTECPNGYDCRDGVCKEMEYKCTKSFGNDTTVKGHIVVSKGLNPILDEYDECVDEGTVKEWVCYENGSGGYELLYCGTGMRCPDGEGRCVRSSCVETDDGDDPEHFGEITFKDKDDEYRDVCISDERLREYYCYGNTVESRTYTCANESCIDDECVPE